MARPVFFISDHTGLTAESLAHTLLTQFDGIDFHKERAPFIDTEEKAQALLQKIIQQGHESQLKPLVFVSIIKPSLRKKFQVPEVLCFDFFDTFMDKISEELGQTPLWIQGKAHGVSSEDAYDERMEAINFSLDNDDGITHKNLAQADIILLGVSRSGKTPTCLYIALQFGLKTANYPLTPEDLCQDSLPKALLAHRKKLYGLSIDPTRLHHIREERQPHSHYASLANCQKEVSAAESLYNLHHIPFISTTHRSIEEIASKIIQNMPLNKSF